MKVMKELLKEKLVKNKKILISSFFVILMLIFSFYLYETYRAKASNLDITLDSGNVFFSSDNEKISVSRDDNKISSYQFVEVSNEIVNTIRAIIIERYNKIDEYKDSIEQLEKTENNESEIIKKIKNFKVLFLKIITIF